MNFAVRNRSAEKIGLKELVPVRATAKRLNTTEKTICDLEHVSFSTFEDSAEYF